jgi:hypothetical protein
LPPGHGTSSFCRWRKQPPAMEVDVNKLNKQPTRSVPPAWRLGVGLTTFHHTKSACYKNSKWVLNLVWFPNNIGQKWISTSKNWHQQSILSRV